MNYELVEQQIADRLTTKLGINFEVAVLPETEEEYKVAFGKSRATVSYKASDFATEDRASKAASRGLGAFVTQEEHVIFEITLQSKKLRGAVGLYAMLEKVKRALVGYTPTDCQKMQILKFGFIERIENIFTYHMLMSTTTTVVEEEDAQNLPLITEITASGDLGESLVPNEIIS